MAKFSQYTLNQVAGFDQQILAQQLVINQKDFWNFAWTVNNTNNAGWTTGTGTPINLTGATISAEIKRRQITDLDDSRGGINFTIVDYPAPEPIGVITSFNNDGYFQTTTDVVNNLYVNQPVYFKNTISGLVPNQVYIINALAQPGKILLQGVSGTIDTGNMIMYNGLFNATSPISLPITNRDDPNGTFTMTIDESTWSNILNDPGFNIDAQNPVCFTGRIKVSFPASGSQPAYDEVIFLLFLVTTDGVTN